MQKSLSPASRAKLFNTAYLGFRSQSLAHPRLYALARFAGFRPELSLGDQDGKHLSCLTCLSHLDRQRCGPITRFRMALLRWRRRWQSLFEPTQVIVKTSVNYDAPGPITPVNWI